MAIKSLDTQCALILIDLQKGIVARAPKDAAKVVLKNASTLARAFRQKGLPVVLVNVSGSAPGRTEKGGLPEDLPSDFIELMPELEAQPGDHRITKETWGAFASTLIEDWLRKQGVTQIVLGGIATSRGVESTARQAFEAGFNVALATDAMTDMSPEAHENSIERIFPFIGERASSVELLALLGQQA